MVFIGFFESGQQLQQLQDEDLQHQLNSVAVTAVCF